MGQTGVVDMDFVSPEPVIRALRARYVDTYLPPITMGTPEGMYLAWLDCRQARIPHDDPYTLHCARVCTRHSP
jgi:bifunctional pyridoxal-dependent enzyme with beta-cystathionase and maltose regulon repressor activities